MASRDVENEDPDVIEGRSIVYGLSEAFNRGRKDDDIFPGLFEMESRAGIGPPLKVSRRVSSQTLTDITRNVNESWKKTEPDDLAKYDLILESYLKEETEDKKTKRISFIQELKNNKIKVYEKTDADGRIIYGLWASDEMINESYQSTIEDSDSSDVMSKNKPITKTKRIEIVHSKLQRIEIEDPTNKNKKKNLNLEKLLSDHVFEDLFYIQGRYDLILVASPNPANAKSWLDELANKGIKKFMTQKFSRRTTKEEDDIKSKRREDFIKQLQRKNIEVDEKINDDGTIFYGLRGKDEIFEDYQYLLKESPLSDVTKDEQISMANRIRVVHFILHQIVIFETNDNKSLSGNENPTDKKTQRQFNLEKLIKNNVFESVFCLHDEEEQEKLRRTPTFAQLKEYLGEQVALYYLWLDTYTRHLRPAGLFGVVVLLYGVFALKTSPLIKEVCQSNITMCPRCDKCDVWDLSDNCFDVMVNLLFDNEATVFFAFFMAVWTTISLEMWKRRRIRYAFEWKLHDWCEEEDELIMHTVNDPEYNPKPLQHSHFRKMTVIFAMTCMLVLIFCFTISLVVIRVVVGGVLAESRWDIVRDHSNTVAVAVGALLHFIIFQSMCQFNRLFAFKLCEFDKPESLAAKEKSFTLKMFTLQFFTIFSSLFYVAFFLGRINGHPGKYLLIAGKLRMEECHPSGCFADLFIQLTVILGLKQTVNSIMEYVWPEVKAKWSKWKINRQKRSDNQSLRKTSLPQPPLAQPIPEDWLRNYQLADTDHLSLFNEIMEMVIQFSFTTIFVAAFPPAPILAFLNNRSEMKLDARKILFLEKRLIPRKANNLGVWTSVLETIGVMAVVTNGLIIAFSSDFIPRLVYKYHYGPCTMLNTTAKNCMEGYISNTLSIANATGEIPECRYKGYRDTNYNYTDQFWLVLASRFTAFVLFEHAVMMVKAVSAWLVPDYPIEVKNKRREAKLIWVKTNPDENNNKKRTSFKRKSCHPTQKKAKRKNQLKRVSEDYSG